MTTPSPSLACFAMVKQATPEELVRGSTSIVRAEAVEFVGRPIHVPAGDEGLALLQLLMGVGVSKGPSQFPGGPPWWLAPYYWVSDSEYTLVRLRVVESLKGAFEHGELLTALARDDFLGRNQGDVPYKTARVGAGALCFALDYRLGSQYLLLIRNDVLYYQAMAPTNEEVDGATDPWVVWVRSTVRSQSLGETPRRNR